MYSGIDYPGDNLLRGIIYFVTPVSQDYESRPNIVSYLL